MRVGSLCTGYGGLDLAVHAVFGTHTAWTSEVDTHAAKVTAARFPDAPNLGDLTVVDWAQVEPVDVLTAGYPCQPFSHAGRRQGTADVRHLWPHIARAIGVLRPRLVVLENVAGHLSLGFDRVLGDLAGLGFDAEWCAVRASEVGACHRRARLFIAATDAGRSGAWRDAQAVPRPATEGGRSGTDVHPVVDAGAAAPTHPHGERLIRWEEQDERPLEPGQPTPRRSDPDGLAVVIEWGEYWPAVRRHEAVLGRRAPTPTLDGRSLAPRFVEWMMMLPEGWVTDLDLSRAQALKILGNGVVPAQAAMAIDGLTRRMLEWEAAA